VIVRISNEGQYELGEDDESELDQLDQEAVAACQGQDEQHFHEAFTRLLDFIRANGRRVPDDELSGSQLILPPPDTSLEEARAEFTGEGLIPG
jgi:hypothetical protein